MRAALWYFEQRLYPVMAIDRKAPASGKPRGSRQASASITGLPMEEIRAAAMELRAQTMRKAYKTAGSTRSGTGRESNTKT